MTSTIATYDVPRIYELVVPPLPPRDPDFCLVPWCTNVRGWGAKKRPRTLLCPSHALPAKHADWTATQIAAREFAWASRPGVGCANPSCPTEPVARAARILDTERKRVRQPRRYHLFGGEFLCRPCTALAARATTVAPAGAELELLAFVEQNLPQVTRARLLGEPLLLSRTPDSLDVVDGLTVRMYALGVASYVSVWRQIRAGVDPEVAYASAEAWAAAERLAGRIPEHTPAATPHPIVVHADSGQIELIP